ncbi:MAG: hypothetical protein M3301_06740, partial [Chloroflexota bacterium]|nr:hypothetical protein [Chloroflexota bacterium]
MILMTESMRRRLVSTLNGLIGGSGLLLVVACSGAAVQAEPPATSEARRTFPAVVTAEETPAEAPAASPTKAPAGGAPAKPATPAPAKTVDLSVDTAKGAEEFKFVQTALEAPAGSRIRVRLNNMTDP